MHMRRWSQGNAHLNDFLRNIGSEYYKRRLMLTLAVAALAFCLMFSRLVYLQLVMGEEFLKQAATNSLRLQRIVAPRGIILDANGERLAENVPSFDVNITVKDVPNLDETLYNLARCLDVSYEILLARVTNGRKTTPLYKPIIVERDISKIALTKVLVNNYLLPGVSVDTGLRREYVYQDLAAHVVGYIGEINKGELESSDFPGAIAGDYIGKMGIERAFDLYLRGTSGGRQVEVNAVGRVQKTLKEILPQEGYNIYLTIDIKLQKLAEELLHDVGGAVVAVDPRDGRVLCLVSSPRFDLNLFNFGISRENWAELQVNPLRPLENKAIRGEYPPGSTYKGIVALAALEEGLVTPQTTFFCGGKLHFGNHEFRCWNRGGHGNVNLETAMAVSCDVYFYQLGLKLGPDKIAKYANMMGLGSVTGIEIGNERPGLIPTRSWKQKRYGENWYDGENLSIAIGQGYDLATPLQLAMFTATVANDGYLYTPFIVAKITDGDGNIVHEFKPALKSKLPVKSENLRQIQNGMFKVVNAGYGTGRRAALSDVLVAGKTGTSQVVSRRTKGDEPESEKPVFQRPHALFIAYAPYDDPIIAMAVVVENGEGGGTAALPVAKELLRFWLDKNGISE